MTFHALLVSLDDNSARILTEVFDEFLLGPERCSHADAAPKFEDQRFDVIAIDLDHALTPDCIADVRRSSRGKTSLILGLLSHQDQLASAFGAGTNFILYKPVARDNAVATARAIVALAKRERRRQFRVPVQVPVSLSWDGSAEVEGIMLDLSEGGMDVLAAKPLEPRKAIEVGFSLSNAADLRVRGQVVWANPNGQSGLQMLDVSDEHRKLISEWLRENAPIAVPEDTEPLEGYTLSDLSSGACYIETAAPFPIGTRLDLCFRAPELEVHLDGKVRVVHPSFGMGVEFAHNTQQRDFVDTFISFLGQNPGISPSLLVLPKSIDFNEERRPAAAEQEEINDALLQLLRDDAGLGRDEFVAALRAQRHSQAEATTA
jgi:hypothetical protein